METAVARLGNERGSAIPLIALSLVVLIGFTGLGVEVGRMASVATEVQNAADIAATAAAMQYVDPPAGDLSTPRQSAETVLSKNSIEGNTVGSEHLTLLEFGNFDDETFTANLAPINAVHARVEYTVHNLILAGMGFTTSEVTKEAIAGFKGVATGVPTIPLAIGDCLLNEGCLEQSCQPLVRQVPSPDDNSAWTGFFSTASTNQLLAFFPSECGGSATPPTIHAGDFITLNNGQESPLLNQVQCLFDHGMREVLVPVVTCGSQLNQSREVLGFARFEIVSVYRTGNPKGFDIQGLVSANESPPGGDMFGAGSIVLLR